MRFGYVSSAAVAAVCFAAPAWAQPASVESLSADLAQARERIDAQQRALDAQDARIRALEARLEGAMVPTAPGAVVSPQPGRPGIVTVPAPGVPTGVEQVGEAPEIEMPQVAVLGDQGNILTRAGQLTVETQFDYARSDRNRVLFRGIELLDTNILIGVFDVNESHQDVLTFAESIRFGVTNRFEVGVRVPLVYRSDKSILAPIAGTEDRPEFVQVDNSADRKGLGDIEFLARYQLTPARRDLPFLIGAVQVVAPTGSSPFEVRRDSLGRPFEAATGAGFWSVTPTLTAILPTDPAVIFGSIGYSVNFGKDVNTEIPPVLIDYVDPGDAIAASLGIGISLNQRTSFNIGYSHSWSMGTKTRTRLIDPPTGEANDPVESKTRDLQLGRLLFGMTYRVNNRASVNWTVEVGATEDASDVRTVVRIPIILLTGR